MLQEKLKGAAIGAAGNALAVRDDDGVQGDPGKAQFLRLGRLPLA